MKRVNAILLLLIMLFLTIGIVSVLYNLLTVVNIKDIEMDIKVGNKIGIIVDNDKLWFGMTNPSGTSTRKMVVGNDYDYPLAISFTPLGEIKQWISVSENPAVLNIGETKEIGITATVPPDTPYGNYTGIMRVIFTKARE